MLISSIAHHTLYFHFISSPFRTLYSLQAHLHFLHCLSRAFISTLFSFSSFFFLLFLYFKFMQITSSCNVLLVTANCVHMDMLHTLSSPTTTSRLYDLAFTSRKKQSFYKWTAFMVFGLAWRPSVGGESNCKQQSSRLKFVLTSSWRLLAQSKSYFDSFLG